MKRKIWFWLCFVASIILGVYFATRIIMTCMGYGSVGTVRQISFSADVSDMDLAPVAAAAGVVPGTRAATVDLDAMRARINAVPGVRDAAVRRMPNGALRVRVAMYRAVAQWSDGMAYYPLSADGTVVKSPTDERDGSAIVFMGQLPDDISDITTAARAIANHVDYMTWVEDRRWDIMTTRGIRVMLPETNPNAAIATLITLDQNHGILSRGITLIDMRDDARILVK